ncbi:Regulator of telomere elongation helicase 1, RTEL1 [Carpediemonas membranifera]|uniref:Regulator of telomere elongation helicase 1, RTEL1 n=1 Tax=Carpediemonas membranifera TaxID=201153 RepID=A0A8J6AT32_9EUKA|nr:Regulator of telomere elongation helicase 1, RTEL1 [Carpediemonas membranifera]|eukprot:KAG9390780.1 Regulator of telomere elongation helicase 1, RTEL1 [Carpediemonas membranifera]
MKVRGVTVNFPFKPYHVQIVYINKLIEGLNNRQNSLLESPTGTGKTLCLLTGTIGWQQAYFDAVEYIESFKGGDEPAPYQHQFGVQLDPRAPIIGLCDELKDAAANPRQFAAVHTAAGQRGEDLAQAFGRKAPMVVYASRTHSQLKQVMAELHKLRLKRPVSMGIMGSRAHLCINQKAKDAGNLDMTCRTMMVQRKCRFARDQNFDSEAESFLSEATGRTGLFDMEDLVSFGSRRGVCPLYISRKIVSRCPDVVFMPYNYLLTPAIRNNMKIPLKGAVVIVDEAHNIESVCMDSFSDEISTGLIGAAIDGFNQIVEKSIAETVAETKQADEFQPVHKSQAGPYGDADALFPAAFSQKVQVSLTAEEVQFWNDALEFLQQALAEYTKLPRQPDSSGREVPAAALFESLKMAMGPKMSLLPSPTDEGRGLVDSAAMKLETVAVQTDGMKAGWKHGLSATSAFFSRLCEIVETQAEGLYKIWVQPADDEGGREGKSKAKAGDVIKIWAMNPGFAIESLFKQGQIRSLVLTSGTLGPLPALDAELKVGFPVQLENDHVIPPQSLWAGVVCKGPGGIPLNSSFKNRADPGYLRALGGSVLAVVQAVAGGRGGGCLVFFPSHGSLGSTVKAWEMDGTFDAIQLVMPVFVEPRTQRELGTVLDLFTAETDNPKRPGAVLCAVCRGRISEGIDFADRRARAVMIVGIPFPAFKDPRVVLKRQYQDEAVRRAKAGGAGEVVVPGDDWYKLSGRKPVNQAIGRVIRHIKDFGAVIFLDERFAYRDNRESISAWVKRRLRVYPDSQSMTAEFNQWWHHIDMTAPPDASPAASNEEPAPLSEVVDVSRVGVFQPPPLAQIPAEPPAVNMRTVGRRPIRVGHAARRPAIRDKKGFMARLKSDLNTTEYSAFKEAAAAFWAAHRQHNEGVCNTRVVYEKRDGLLSVARTLLFRTDRQDLAEGVGLFLSGVDRVEYLKECEGIG